SDLKTEIPSPDESIDRCHVNRVEVDVCLLELVRGRAVDHPAGQPGESEEFLGVRGEALALVEQGRLRVDGALEEVDRLLVVSDVALELKRARLLSGRGHKLLYQRLELFHLIDADGEHPVHLFAPHPCLHGTVCLKMRTPPTIGAAEQMWYWTVV